MEPPRPRLPDRAGPPLLTAGAPRVRLRRRVDRPDASFEPTTDSPPISGPPDLSNSTSSTGSLRLALLVGALVLAVASRGDVVVLALLLGLGAASRASGFAVTTALAAAMVRWGSPSLRAMAGAQAVLGPAGWTGSSAAVVSAWLGALALVTAARPDRDATRPRALLGVAPFAAAAADVVVGPAIGGAVAFRVAGTIVALGLGSIVPRLRWAPAAACVLGAVALLAAGAAR